MSFYVPSTPSRHRSRSYSLAQPTQMAATTYPYPATPYSGYNTLAPNYYDNPSYNSSQTYYVAPSISGRSRSRSRSRHAHGHSHGHSHRRSHSHHHPHGHQRRSHSTTSHRHRRPSHHALTANPQASLIPPITPQLLESASSVSLVSGTITVMLTSMVVPSTIAGGHYTNIKIRVEMTEYPPVSSRVRDRSARVCAKNILAQASIPTSRVSTLSYHAMQSLETSHFILSIPADFPAPPPRTVTSKQQLGRTSHT
ncbi:hypothetical protein H4582DRAFT_80680 [Lactarius indigo]|nr:hypothetical protein H4582DRAFT_80680 [Lactarius indigo]